MVSAQACFLAGQVSVKGICVFAPALVAPIVVFTGLSFVRLGESSAPFGRWGEAEEETLLVPLCV